MAAPKWAVGEPRVAELLAEEITHMLMRADHVAPGEVAALVERVQAELARSPDGDQRGEVRS